MILGRAGLLVCCMLLVGHLQACGGNTSASGDPGSGGASSANTSGANGGGTASGGQGAGGSDASGNAGGTAGTSAASTGGTQAVGGQGGGATSASASVSATSTSSQAAGGEGGGGATTSGATTAGAGLCPGGPDTSSCSEGDTCAESVCCSCFYSCVAGSWLAMCPPCEVPLCPESAPEPGTACDPCDVDSPCTYGGCSVGALTVATCAESGTGGPTWSVDVTEVLCPP